MLGNAACRASRARNRVSRIFLALRGVGGCISRKRDLSQGLDVGRQRPRGLANCSMPKAAPMCLGCPLPITTKIPAVTARASLPGSSVDAGAPCMLASAHLPLCKTSSKLGGAVISITLFQPCHSASNIHSLDLCGSAIISCRTLVVPSPPRIQLLRHHIATFLLFS